MFSTEDDKVSSDSLEIKGKGIISTFTDINKAINDTFLQFKATDNVFENFTKSLTSFEQQTVSSLRTMGGVFNLLDKQLDANGNIVGGVGRFQQRIIDTQKEVQNFGGSFKDIKETIDGLADAMGRAVNPSKEAMINMVALSKTTGLTTKEIAGMVEQITSFGGTQVEATAKISEMAKTARKVGLDANKFVKSMAADIDKVGGFGFKDGVKNLERMTKQAQMLKTTFGNIIGSLQDTVLDPEGAIETAAKFQMLGGEVGKLADPFQLMYMAQTDMEGLQKELVKSTQAAFKFNAETGNFDASTQDLYRLREQAQITGTKLEDLVKTGREAAKLDYIKDKFDLSQIKDQDTKDLLAGLAEVGKDGKVTIDIPGFGKIEEGQTLSAEATAALEDYQKKASMTEKEIAEQQLTTSEKSARDVEMIKNSVLLMAGIGDRDAILQEMQNQQKSYSEATVKLSEKVGGKIVEKTTGVVTKIGNEAVEKFQDVTGFGPDEDETKQMKITNQIGKIIDNFAQFSDFTGGQDVVRDDFKAEDLFIPSSGQGPKVMAEGKIFKGIVGDEVAMGTNLTEAFNRVSTLKDLISNQTKNTSEKQNLDGNLKIDINLGGKVDGDKNADLSKLFSSPIFQKQLMDMVLYKMKDYQKQQGVL